MKFNENSTLVPKNQRTGAERISDSRGIEPTLPIQTGLRAGLFDGISDGTAGNDAARGFGAISAVSDWLANWFS
jgi:hypothetical protein